MNKEELIKYEAPYISEFVNGWLGTLVAKYIAWKINRKLSRYNKRIERERFILKSLIKE